MGNELSAISPVLLNTMGGLVALLFVVMIINAITKLIRQYRPAAVPAGNGKGGNGSDIFAKSVRFNLHDKAQENLCRKVETVEKKVDDIDRHFSRLIAIGERQAEALERLVEMRSEIVKAELIHAGKG